VPKWNLKCWRRISSKEYLRFLIENALSEELKNISVVAKFETTACDEKTEAIVSRIYFE